MIVESPLEFEGGREREAHEAASEDDHVRTIHRART